MKLYLRIHLPFFPKRFSALNITKKRHARPPEAVALWDRDTASVPNVAFVHLEHFHRFILDII